jgi:hypothetical protein
MLLPRCGARDIKEEAFQDMCSLLGQQKEESLWLLKVSRAGAQTQCQVLSAHMSHLSLLAHWFVLAHELDR